MLGTDSPNNAVEHEERKCYHSRIVIGLAMISLVVVGVVAMSNTYQTQDLSKFVELEQHDLTDDIREVLNVNAGEPGIINADTVTSIRPRGRNRGIRFGQSVAVKGNIAVVGAPKDLKVITKAGNKMYKGGVLVLRRNRNRYGRSKNWRPVQHISVREGFELGYKVALGRVGRTLYLVASSIDDKAVHVFKMRRGRFVRVQKVRPRDRLNWTGYGSSFGSSVTLCGEYLIVGARHGTVNGLYYFGGVYIYKFSRSSKKFVQMQRILSKYQLGHFNAVASMSTSRPGMLVVGSMAHFGKVRIMKLKRVRLRGSRRSIRKFVTVKLLTNKMRVFGSAISLQGKYLAVGAYLPQLNGAGVNNPGSVFLYKEVSPNKWRLIKRLTKGRKGQGFGSSVKITRDLNLIVGAKKARKGRGVQRGAVFGWTISGRKLKYIGAVYGPCKNKPCKKSDERGFGKSLDVCGNTMIVGGFGKGGKGIAVIYS